MLITVGAAIVTLILTQYPYRDGMWRPFSPLSEQIHGFGGIAIVLSFVTSLVAIAKERPRMPFLSLFLSVLSFFLYVD